MKIIGLTGRKRAGKDTVAHQIRSHVAYPWRQAALIESFAGPIREFTAKFLGWTAAELEEHKESPLARLDGVTPRHMMQTLGTEWGRKMILDDLWVRRVEALLEQEIKVGSYGVAVITDVRFANEAKMIRSMDGLVLRIERPGFGAPDAHSSETPIDDALVDATILNDGTVQELSKKVGEFLTQHAIPA